MTEKMPLKELLTKWSVQVQLAFAVISVGIGGAWSALSFYPDIVAAWGLDQASTLKSIIVGILAVNAAVSSVTVYLRGLPQGINKT